MGKTYPGIDARNAAFIRQQQIFFVATAPSSLDGHVNLSPKGLKSFAILNENTVAYLDLVGSGIETAAHLRENGRIALLFCAFEGPPRLLRLHGRGEVVEPGDEAWDLLRESFPPYDAARCIIRVAVARVSDSCGYGVPLYQYQGDRTQLLDWAERKRPEGIAAYKAENNRSSIDGLPGLRRL
jgi:hypothetical protein